MEERISERPLDKGLVIEWAKGLAKILSSSDKIEAKNLLAQLEKDYRDNFASILIEDTKRLYDLDLISALKTKEDGMAVEFLKWIKQLSLGIDALEDKEIAKKALREASRACASNMVKLIKGAGEVKDLDSFIDTMNRLLLQMGAITEKEGGMVKKKENLLYMSCNTPHSKSGSTGRCSCPLVIHGVIEPTPSHCFCSEGCFQIVIAELMGRPVKVKTLKGLARGDRVCAFEIQF